MDRLDLFYAADDAAALTIKNGGGTFDAATLAPVAPTTGYAVGGLAPVVKVDATPLLSRVDDAIVLQHDRAKAPYIGTWVDNGKVYIDAVVILPDLASAGILARTLGELAVYDFANGKSIESEDAR